jgi:signal peptidase I
VSGLRLAVGALVLLVVGGVWALFLVGALKPYEVISDSMAPTLVRGDRVLMRAEGRVPDLHGRIVVFVNPKAPSECLTKRVVADGGDAVEVSSGTVLINGRPEDAVRERLRHVRDRKWVLGADEVFVLGDNRNDSFDSIDFGPLPRNSVDGVVVYRYWPRQRTGTVN